MMYDAFVRETEEGGEFIVTEIRAGSPQEAIDLVDVELGHAEVLEVAKSGELTREVENPAFYPELTLEALRRL